MKISLSWLKTHLPTSAHIASPQELAERLTAVGLEVEAVEDKAAQFAHVVVGQIQKLEKHPNADRLTVCQLDVGDGELKQIVCGAKNHKQGDKVVVTLPGAVLPGDFAIKKSKIRDVESSGMLASESELGLKKESEGILILPADAPVGESFAKYFGLEDVTLEINVTPNRADCLSHLGLAREVGSLYQLALIEPPIEMQMSKAMKTKERVALEVLDKDQAPRYSGRWIKGVKVGPSPAWLRQRLESVGMNSINNIVDVTNFVMMDLGQPLHAFDLAKIEGNKVIVSGAEPGEKMTTLDGTELTLGGGELCIRNVKTIMCLAGVIGGKDSGVTDSTTDVFIESAHFSLESVRRTARRHGLQTDSAYRFSRGTDPGNVIRALDLACSLIQKVAGGEIAADHWDFYPRPIERAPIRLEVSTVGERLGYPVSEDDLSQVLLSLGCKISKGQDKGVLEVLAPAYRLDLEQDVDLVEEYGRIKGYDQIPETLPPLNYAPLSQDKAYGLEVRMALLARQAGFSQAVNFGFVSSAFQSAVLGSVESYRSVGLDTDANPIKLQNPLSDEYDVMRVSLLPGLIRNLLHNARHGLEFGRLFELGYVFRHGPDGYDQKLRLGLLGWGELSGLWQPKASDSSVFFDVKARVEGICAKLLISQVQFNEWAEPPKLFHPGQAAGIFIEGRHVGFVASVHPAWLEENKIRWPVVLAEFDAEALMRGQPRAVRYKPISKFPAVERDLAFVMPKTLRSQDVQREIQKAAGVSLQSVRVFDVFEGGNLPEGHISIAYRMVFQNPQSTFTENELSDLQSQIVNAVEKKLGIRVR